MSSYFWKYRNKPREFQILSEGAKKVIFLVYKLSAYNSQFKTT